MNNAKRMTVAERAGHTVGRWLKSVMRLESSVVQNAVAVGVPCWLALALKWAVRLALAAGLLYIAAVPAVLILGFLIVLFLHHSDDDRDFIESDEEDEQIESFFQTQTYMKRAEDAMRFPEQAGHLHPREDQALDADSSDDILH
ncbi:DUF3742 family protein [Pseudomonas chlororaphis subsp. aureofaciens]|uniref:DUF3742 family protein n=1 Tax=Pseudomonas TaxID=286 RepID=UPI00236087C7|nr:DUF3742 family protein [Pseudomonas sp. SBT1-2]